MRGFRCWIGVGIAATGLSVGSLAAGEMNGMSSDPRLGEAASIEAVARAFLPDAQWQHQDAASSIRMPIPVRSPRRCWC